MIDALLWVFNTVTLLYIAVLIALVIMSWLTAFKVVDAHHAVVAQVDRGLFALTDPLVNPVRRVIPSLGGLDFSPIIVVIAVEFLRIAVNSLLAAPAA